MENKDLEELQNKSVDELNNIKQNIIMQLQNQIKKENELLGQKVKIEADLNRIRENYKTIYESHGAVVAALFQKRKDKDNVKDKKLHK